ncbi:MAG TPA: HAMP domain-containing sensor histidine kinase [Aggregatilineales bacterium]|nr:HAMP domain-containing sensor histidine kinase [Aggregatilineales bacterium]
MLPKLLNGPWPDQGDVPEAVREQAVQRILLYWRLRMWVLVLGEAIILFVGIFKDPRHLRAYTVMLILVTLIYVLGLFPRIRFVWLASTVFLLGLHGMLVRGMGGAVALSYMLPYTLATMLLGGRRRLIVQALCVVGFWFNLLYEFAPAWGQLNLLPYFLVSYNILIATITFQGLRFLSRLTTELNNVHVSQEVTQQVTQRSQQFLARVSHELRTPLNSILGFAKLMRRADLPVPQSSYLQQIVEEGEQLNSLISDLLDSAQLSAGKLMLTPADCDVNEICNAIASEIHTLLKPGVTLGTNLLPDLPHLQADPLRLRQIVRNLVGNAAKYTAQGRISLSTRCQAGEIWIEVSDTGPGIPVDQQPQVFVPFLKLDGRSAGIGLGLDIALQLARLHGGDIRLSSIPGEGSTFSVLLPLNGAAQATSL